MSEPESQERLQQVLGAIRPSVRRERPYIVGGDAKPSVKLNQNESPFDLPPELKQELAERFLTIPANRYPAEQPWELRERLAAVFELTPESILIGNGSNELTHTLGLTFIAPGAPVVVPRPMFALYESVIRMFDGRVVPIAPRGDLSFDADAIAEARRREQPPLTIITTPNNPTGLAMSIGEIRAILEAAPGVVVVDEAYWEFNPEQPATSLLADHPNLIIVRTFSKAMGLAGIRLGYLVAHPDVVAELMKARLPFMIDRFSEEVGLALLQRPELIADRVASIKESRDELQRELRALAGVEVLPTAANFLLFKTAVEPSDLLDGLASDGIALRSMAGYPELRGYLRVSAGTPAENKAFLAALKHALQ